MSHATTGPVPIDQGLFTGPVDAPRLVASRCDACGELTFPRQASCPACTSRKVGDVHLGRRGTLWTWTVQRFPPPRPYIGDADRDAFVPYGVGYVELPEGIRVEGRLTGVEPEDLRIGMEMELVAEPFRAADGGERLTFAFRPAPHEAAR